MKAPVALALLLTLLALGPVGCATTSNQEKSPEQLRLEAEYNALREQKQAIEQEERAVHARAKKLYRQASSLEAKRKLGSPKSLVVDTGAAASKKAAVKVGPLKLDKKSASFTILPGNGVPTAQGNVRTATVKPQ